MALNANYVSCIGNLTDVKALAEMALEAFEAGQAEKTRLLMDRVIALSPAGEGAGPVSRRIYRTMIASEMVHSRNGYRHSRTRQMLARYEAELGVEAGAIGVVEKVVSNAKESSGFRELVKIGANDLLFERIVLDFPEAFSAKALANAKAREAAL
jgi:hypothetical protein